MGLVSYLLLVPQVNARSQSQDGKASCQLISSRDAVAKARQQVNGKVVSVKLSNGRKPVYRVRILVDKKRIKNLTINACR